MCGVSSRECDATCRGVGCVTVVSNASLEHLLALAPEHTPYCAGPPLPGSRGPPRDLLSEQETPSSSSADGSGVCAGSLRERIERTVGRLTAIARLLLARSADLDQRATLVCHWIQVV